MPQIRAASTAQAYSREASLAQSRLKDTERQLAEMERMQKRFGPQAGGEVYSRQWSRSEAANRVYGGMRR